MQKLNSIQAYKLVEEGQAVVFRTEDYLRDQGRVIKMRVNTANDVRLYVTNMEPHVTEDGELVEDTRLLAALKPGLDELYFAYHGDFRVEAVGGEIWLDTYDASNFEVQPTDLESYARVLQREEIDPRVAAMQYEIRLAQRQFQLQMERDRMEYEQRIAALEASKAPTNVAPTATAPATAETGTTAVQPTVGGESANATAGATSGATGGEPNGTAGG